MSQLEQLIKEASDQSNLTFDQVAYIADHMETYLKIGAPYGKDFDGFYSWFKQKS